MALLRRSVRVVVRGWPDVRQALRSRDVATVLFDVEPLLRPWSGTGDLSGVEDDLRDRLTDLPSVRRVAVVTNSKRYHGSGRLEVYSGARKPWCAARFVNGERPLAIVGDTVLTDGLLAWRLDALFVHWAAPDPPWWPRVQRWCGRIVAPLLFRTVPA